MSGRTATDAAAATQPPARNASVSCGTSANSAASTPTRRTAIETPVGTSVVAPSATTETSEVMRVINSPE